MSVRINRLSDLGNANRDFTKQMKRARKQLQEMPDAINKPISFWLPLPISVNDMYYTDKAKEVGKAPRRRLTAEANAWKKNVGEIVQMEALSQGWKCTRHSKVVIEITVYWPDDGHKHDMNNLHKILLDALEKTIYWNDSKALIRDMDFNYTTGRPKVELKIYQMDG